MKWYYAVGSNQMGPVSDAELGELARAGKLQAGTLVWHAGQDGWLPYGEIAAGAGLPLPAAPPPPPAPAPAAPAAPAAQPASFAAAPGELAMPPAAASPAGTTAFCAACGQQFEQENMVHYMGSWICMSCKPAYFQRMREGAAIAGGSGSGDYAGFWIRFGAIFIDGIILYVVSQIISFIFVFAGSAAIQASHSSSPFAMLAVMAPLIIIQLSIRILYYGLFTGRYGATPGKMALSLKVVTPDGAAISYGRAFARAFAMILSGIVCYIGFIIAAFDEEKRTLHDHICGTRVVRK